MLQSINSGGAVVDIGHGLTLSLGEDGRWQVVGANGTWSLEGERDFYRAVTLLEKSFAEASEAVHRCSMARPNSRPFQFEAVVKMALQSATDHWASLALEWFPHLLRDQRKALTNELRAVIDSRWASQKVRQHADRELKQLTD